MKDARLSLLGRLCAKAPADLFSMVSALSSCEGSRAAMVCSDLQWLSSCPVYSIVHRLNFNTWCDIIEENPKFFKRRFVKLRIAKIPLAVDATKPVICSHSVSSACSECPMVSDSFQSLSLHMFEKHGLRNLWRRYVHMHTRCPICLCFFSNRERLINHIRHRSKICKHKNYPQRLSVH